MDRTFKLHAYSIVTQAFGKKARHSEGRKNRKGVLMFFVRSKGRDRDRRRVKNEPDARIS